MTIAYAKKPSVLAQLPLDRHAVIEASAGTGKTYALEHLVIEILLTTDVTLDRILVVTFTEKAASELRARLRAKITSLLEAPPSDPPEEGDAWRIDDEAKKKLSRALLSFDGASISTIHAFCQRVLAENAFESGRHFEQELIDGRAAFERAFYAVLRTRIARGDTERGFLDAWLARHTLDQLRALLWEAHERRGRFEPPYDEPGLVATLKTLSHMELTPHALRPAMSRARIPPATVHALLERFAFLHTTLAGYERDGDLPKLLEALEGEDRRRPLLSYAIEKLGEHVTEEGKLRELQLALEALAKRLAGFESAVCQRFLPLVRAELSSEKSRKGELDYDDMLVLLEESLRGENGPAMIDALRRRFAYALIDEFQDTDEVQWAIFSKVFLEGGRSILYVIGDPKQAIYGFRGADVHAYLEAKQRIGEHDGHTVHLTESFRATARLVDALNVVLDDEASPPIFDGEIRYDHPVSCGRPELPDLEVDGHVASPVHVFEVQPSGETFARLVHARRTHAKAIAETIAELLDGDRTKRDGQAIDAREIFVLTRSTREGGEIAEALRAQDVPHAFYKQDGLFQTREAADVRDLLAAIADPLHESHRLRAWQSPFFAVPLERLASLQSLAGGHRLMKLLLDWKTLAEDKRFERLYTSIIEETGLVERELFLRSSERELTNYLHVFEVLLEEAHNFGVNLAELITFLDALIAGRRAPPGEDGNAQRIESESPAVQIMTMHKAKGLEASVVFLYGGLDEPFGRVRIYHEERERLLHVGPRPPIAVDIENAEENQRLIYVAMTRAKARLYLPYFRPEYFEKRIGGAYAALNERLHSILDAPLDASLFSSSTVEQQKSRHLEVVPTARAEDRLPAWKVPPRIRRPLVAPPDLERLKEAHMGFDVTSYSRIKAEKGGYKPPEGSSLEDEIAADVDATTVGDDVLPNGPATGRFLHEMIELVPLEAVEDAGDLSLFGARRDVRTLFTEGLARYDLDVRHLPEAVELVYRGLASPIQLGEQKLEALFRASRIIREMEFLYPRDEVTFVKGYIDVVFEHDGLAYVLDWKSDLLPDYDKKTIDAHVAKNYAIQAELYSRALVKLLRLRDPDDYEARFGGAVYCFLRGMANDGRRGVYFTRPSFETLTKEEEP